MSAPPFSENRSATAEPSELIRGLVLGEIERDKHPPRASVELEEIASLRLLLLNILLVLARGERMNIQRLVNDAHGAMNGVKYPVPPDVLQKVLAVSAMPGGGRCQRVEGTIREHSGNNKDFHPLIPAKNGIDL
jgi:hypothetical protein